MAVNLVLGRYVAASMELIREFFFGRGVWPSTYLSGSYVCLQSQYSDSRIEEVKPEGGCNRKSSISGQGLYHYGDFPHLDRALYSFHSSINESFHKLFLFRNFSVSQRLWIFGHYSNL